MPIINGVGISEYTKIKQEHFERLLRANIAIAEACIKKHSSVWAKKDYVYIDLNAGPGIYLNEDTNQFTKGSPLIFMDIAKRHPTVKFKGYFIENRECAFESLENNLKKIPQNCQIELFCEDHALVLPALYGKFPYGTFGLIYSDDNGNVPPFDLLYEWTKHPKINTHIDILINIAATTIKRTRMSPICSNKEYLTNLLNKLEKKEWRIREPEGKHQWSFLLGCNWFQYPEDVRMNFFDTKSARGSEILERLNYTAKELNNEDCTDQVRETI